MIETGSPYERSVASKWWSTIKSAVFGSSSSLTPLVSEGGGLVCEPVSKADLLSDHVDIKQPREAVDQPLTSHPSPSFTTFAFRSSEVRRLLLDLDPYGGTDPLFFFLLFLRELLMLWPPVLVSCFVGLFVWVVSRLAGDRPMSPQFQKVHRPLLLPITNQFPWHQYCLRCLSAWCRLVLDDLWNLWCASNHPVCLSESSGYL